jgi:surfeit locus 1 family protein
MRILTSFRKYRLIWLLPTLLVAGLFCYLGFWQLDRAAQKTAILDQIEAAASLPLDSVNADTPMYSMISGSARYLAQSLLLDNQVQAGRQGVHVLTPILLQNRQLLLVNRGWFPLGMDEVPVTDAAPPPGQVTVEGRLAPLPGVGMRLGRQPALQLTDWPELITYVDTPLLTSGYRAALQQPQLQLLPFILKLDAQADHGYAGRDWQLLNFGPNKHLAYAGQWFTLAAAVFATYLILTIRAVRRSETKA